MPGSLRLQRSCGSSIMLPHGRKRYSQLECSDCIGVHPCLNPLLHYLRRYSKESCNEVCSRRTQGNCSQLSHIKSPARGVLHRARRQVATSHLVNKEKKPLSFTTRRPASNKPCVRGSVESCNAIRVHHQLFVATLLDGLDDVKGM
eukprot:758684-Hanusia_phi.AAC.9